MLAKNDCLARLIQLGINWDDACALRRISMTLHRWHELECGDGNDYGSWCITRGGKQKVSPPPKLPAKPHEFVTFVHDDDGAPYLEHHHYLHGKGDDYVTHSRLPDRERGALKRLAAIMAQYPALVSYVQGDPRGCALYVLQRSDIPADASIDSCYSRGVAVYK